MYVATNLDAEMIKSGAELTQQLDNEKIVVKAALWNYLGDQGAWRLIIASPDVTLSGPRKMYQKIQRSLARLHKREEGIGLSLDNISVVEPSYPLVLLLKHAVTTADSISGIRFKNSTINGQVVEDSYIYRLA